MELVVKPGVTVKSWPDSGTFRCVHVQLHLHIQIYDMYTRMYI